MILKELNDPRTIDSYADIPLHEYDFFKAYLVVDEIALLDRIIFDLTRRAFATAFGS
jgi:hypothetical protein